MKKISLITLLAVAVLNTTAFAQEENSKPTSRSLSFYLDSFSGQLNTSSTGGKAFEDNEFEFGAVYSQNFATVPWLSMWVKALIVTGAQPTWDDKGNWTGTSAFFIQPYGIPRVQVGLNFNGYGILALDTRGLLANELYYTVKFADIHSITFQSIIEMWLAPLQGTQVAGKYDVLDLFELRLTYAVEMAKGWTYRSKFGFRFFDETSAKAFGDSFRFRWENQVVWSVDSGFYTWAQLRYEADLKGGFNGDPAHPQYNLGKHNVYLQAGLGYSFDFSKI